MERGLRSDRTEMSSSLKNKMDSSVSFNLISSYPLDEAKNYTFRLHCNFSDLF